MMDQAADPWSVPIAVLQIPDTGLHRDLEADPATRAAMAEVAGLREILSASASLDVTPTSGGRFQVTGHVRARIGQNCVVTLDPTATAKYRPRRSRSKTVSSIWAGSRPTRCSWRSIPIRASRMRCLNRSLSRPILRITRSPP